jgi:hypothetical protein
VPPDVVHGFRNGSDAEVRYLNFHAPGCRFADYLRAVRDRREFSYDQHEPPADGGRPASEAAVGGAELVTDEPGLRVVRLADVDAISIHELRADPDSSLPDLGADFLYVLEGELAVGADGAGAGSWVALPQGASLAVAGGAPTRVLTVRTRPRPR